MKPIIRSDAPESMRPNALSVAPPGINRFSSATIVPDRKLDHEASYQLLSRIARHDESALRELYQQHAGRIFRFVRARLRDDHAAETVMIDTLYEVWKQPHKFRGESLFTTWLLGIAKYKMLNEMRKIRRGSNELHGFDSDETGERLVNPDSDVSKAYDAIEAGQLLRICIEKLSESHRELVRLVYIEGLPMTEIARIQNVPEGTIRTRLYRARKNLKIRFRQKNGIA